MQYLPQAERDALFLIYLIVEILIFYIPVILDYNIKRVTSVINHTLQGHWKLFISYYYFLTLSTDRPTKNICQNEDC